MRRLTTVLYILVLPTWAAEYNTDSTPTAAEVQALHDSAVAGDTINIASGSFDWTDSVTITKGLTIRGAGPGLTTLTRSSGGTIFYVRSSDVTLGYFKVTMAATQIYAINFNGQTSDIDSVRVTNIHFDHSTYKGRDIFRNANSPYNVAALVDHCRFDWDQTADEPIFVHGPNTAWDSPAPFGSGNVIIIENCAINGGGGYTDFNNYGIGVIRYCTIDDNKLDWHGAASNSARGARSSEIYGNIWTGTGSGARIEVRGGSAMIWGNTNTQVSAGLLLIRDYGITNTGWGAFHTSYKGVSNNGGNAQFTGIDSDWLSKNIKVGKSVDHIRASNNGNYSEWNYGDYLVTAKGTTDFTMDIPYNGDDNGTFGQVQTPDARPLVDQVGVGVNQLNGEEPAYVFQNRRPGNVQWKWSPKTASTDGIDLYGASYNDKDMIVPDEDIFEEDAIFDGTSGVGIGTKTEMLAITPTTDNVGFWVTDEGTWNSVQDGFDGQLYKWDGAAWNLYYTPYTYPHPLNDQISEFPPLAPVALTVTAAIGGGGGSGSITAISVNATTVTVQ